MTIIGFILLFIGIIFLLIYIGMTFLLQMEFKTPGLFFTVPGAVLITLGIIGIAAPNEIFSYGSLIVITIVAFVTVVITIFIYQRMVPTEVPATTVATSLVGKHGIVTVAVVPNSLKGKVRIENETWSATAENPIPVGTKVRVIRSEGVHVTVEEVKK